MNIMDLIDRYVNNYEIGTPIYSNKICEFVLTCYYPSLPVNI